MYAVLQNCVRTYACVSQCVQRYQTLFPSLLNNRLFKESRKLSPSGATGFSRSLMHSSYTKKVRAADGATFNSIKTKMDIVIGVRAIKTFHSEDA